MLLLKDRILLITVVRAHFVMKQNENNVWDHV